MWFLFLIFLFPFIIFILFFQVATFSFAKLGLSAQGAVLLFSLSMIGGMINIPVSRRRFVVEEERFFFPFLFYYPPRVREQVIAVNVGGAIIPVVFSLYLLKRTPFWPALIAVLIVTIVARALARPVPGVGISLPAFIPPLVAAAAALLLAGQDAAPVAYIAGVWGTLIGADLLNLHRFRQLGAHVLSIGGAGVFDGIFLVGVVAALLA
ncbi:DUF1614 domain-containing protein [Desulfofundulus sp.]|uniref:DUF1614 domain-containing protein n=1 Tax=Desulfofundulus sp. TaxID=2282750 RepID=UPI003C75DB29